MPLVGIAHADTKPLHRQLMLQSDSGTLNDTLLQATLQLLSMNSRFPEHESNGMGHLEGISQIIYE
jgi:hypothetical protein